MRFGINFFPTVDPSEKTGAEYYAECLDIAEEADQLGFHSIKIVEHYFSSYGGYSPDPLTFLAAASQRTENLRLIPGAAIPAFNHPIKLAGKAAMVDNLSNGRLGMGFARAFLPHEFDAFEVSMDESRERIEEGVDACIRLWTEEDVVFEGQFHKFGPVTLYPRTVQQPHPPIYIAAVQTPASFEWAGENGYNVMVVPYAGTPEKVAEMLGLYRKCWEGAGHEPGAEEVQMSIHCYVSEDGDQAREAAAAAFADYNGKLIDVITKYRPPGESSQYQGYDKMIESLKKKTLWDLLDQGIVFVGTPPEVIEQVENVRELFGEVEPGLQLNFSTVPFEESRRTMRLMAEEVMPHFAD